VAFEIKDSGERQAFAGGMVRDTSEGKTDFTSVRFGPMYRRWAEHTTKGRAKYPDPAPGTPNWTLAEGVAEFLRARESLLRHMEAYLAGELDEDHAAGIFFNVNLMEYTRQHIERLGGAVPFIFETKPATPEQRRLAAALDATFGTDFLQWDNSEEYERMCRATNPNGAWYCERPMGHTGDHGWSPENNLSASDEFTADETRWPAAE
jgi:hypothetical protein